MAVIEGHSADQLIAFFWSEISKPSSKSPNMAQRAVKSLKLFCEGRNLSFETAPEAVIREWLVFLKFNDISWKSAVAYFEAISGLYTRAVTKGLSQPMAEFRNVKSELVKNNGEIWSGSLSKSQLEKLLSLTIQTSVPNSKHIDIAIALILISLINGCMPLADVARIKRDEIDAFDEESRAILERFADRQRKYIFGLNQSERTANQLIKYVNKLVVNLFQRHYLPIYDNVDQTLKTYWAYAALNNGISPQSVLNIIKQIPSGLSVMSLCKPSKLTDEERNKIIESVGRIFRSSPQKWFVMRLRQRVKFEDIDSIFTALKDEIKRPEMFYPCDEVFRKIGKKRFTEIKPVIPDIIFFKCREQEIFPMFCRIGGLAYCYTVTGKSGDAYASIPKAAFERFQEAIGHFTPDYEVAPIGGIPLKEGDSVEIIGGDFQNCYAKIDKIHKSDFKGRTIYRLILQDTGFEWIVSQDSRLVRRSAKIEA